MTEVESKESEDKILAVDAVIIPSQEVRNLAISLSQKLSDSPFVLNPVDYLPHITLVQGYVNDLEKVKEVMRRIASQTSPFTVVVEKTETATEAPEEWGGYYFSYLVMKKDEAIANLHQEIVSALPFVEVGDPKSSDFVTNEGEVVVSGALESVGQFKYRNSQEKYWPHVTLGGSSTPQILTANLPLEFVADEIVLCQLGNFCTCRKILGKWKLTW